MIDQAGDPLCLPFRKPQPGKHLPGYSAAFRGMAVKVGHPVRGKGLSGRLARVVEERGPAERRISRGVLQGVEGVLLHVEAVVRGLLGAALHGGQLRQKGEEDSGVLPQNRGGVFPAEELCQLLPHPFVREGLEPAFFLP